MLQLAQIQPNLFNNHFDFKIHTLSRISKIIKALHLRIKITRLIAGLNNDLSKLFIVTEGLKSAIDNKKLAGDLLSSHEEYKQRLFSFRKTFAFLERVKFFRNNTTRKLCDEILANYYSIEYKLRIAAYPSKESSIDDEELLEFASSLSLNSIDLIDGI